MKVTFKQLADKLGTQFVTEYRAMPGAHARVLAANDAARMIFRCITGKHEILPNDSVDILQIYLMLDSLPKTAWKALDEYKQGIKGI